MNLKSKLFGFGAATVLSLSMVSGALADEATVAVNLNPDVCSASIAESHFSFGSWKWDDDSQKYVAQAGAPSSHEFTAQVRVPYSGAECPVLIELQDQQLTGTDSASNMIPGSELGVTFTSGPLNGRSGNLGSQHTFNAPRSEHTGELSFDPTNETFVPDRYTGVIRFVINDGL